MINVKIAFQRITTDASFADLLSHTLTSSMAQLFSADAIGWIGAGTSLLAYGLVTQQVVPATSLPYLGLNAVACSCLGCYTLRKKAYANALLNSLWLLISLVGLLRFV